MYLSTLKKSNVYVLLMASICSSCLLQGTIEIPCEWHTVIENRSTYEDPACFRWWEAFEDPFLTWLVEQAAFRNLDVRLAAAQSKEQLLEAMNTAAADIARNYIEFRGMQERLEVIHTHIKAQKELISLNDGLSSKGFINTIEQNENQKNLDSLLVQQSQIELSIDKTLFHLSTLLSYAPGSLHEALCPHQNLLKFPNCMPVGCPMELVQRHPLVKEARKFHEKRQKKQTFYNYQKNVLHVLEETENALRALCCDLKTVHYLEDVAQLKAEALGLIKDLYHRGLKNDRDIQTAYQELLTDENALIQSKTQLLINYVNLYQALSTGWEA